MKRGETGELMIQGPNVTPGYWNRPEANRTSFTADGWFHTGDAARQDDDGYYYIVDRWKDMFISGGENVYPVEVENVIYQLAGVLENAVVGVPHDKWGEVGRAFVVLKAGANLDEAAVIEHCGGQLARHKVPKEVRFLGELPHNATGKVLKHQLPRTQTGRNGMASIVFGAGTSHTPMLNMAAEKWPLFEEVDRHRAHLHTTGAPRPTTTCWRRPCLVRRRPRTTSTPASQRGDGGVDRLRDGRQVRTRRGHRRRRRPQGGLSRRQHAERPGLSRRDDRQHAEPDRTQPRRQRRRTRRPNWMERAAARYYEESETRHYPVHAGLANHLITALVEAEFDVSSANALPAGEGEGHAFGFVHRRLMKEAAPVVPIVLNTCYPPNQPSPRRCYRLGQAIRQAIEAIRKSARRRRGVGRPQPLHCRRRADREVIRALARRMAAPCRTCARAASGDSEIRNWICAGGALEHLTCAG